MKYKVGDIFEEKHDKKSRFTIREVYRITKNYDLQDEHGYYLSGVSEGQLDAIATKVGNDKYDREYLAEFVKDKDINVGKVAEKTNEEKAVEEQNAVINQWLKSVKEYL